MKIITYCTITILFLILIASSPRITDENTISTKINQSGLNLLTRVDAGGNSMISSLSITMNLGLTANGAKGVTQTEMLHVMDCDINPITDVNNFFRAQMSKNDGGGNELNIANAIWADKREQLLDNFIEIGKTNFDATVGYLDFSNPTQASQEINGWVKEKTKNKIEEILSAEQLSNASVILANAVYFKGIWNAPFDKQETRSGVFHSETGDMHVSYMNKLMTVGIVSDDEYQLIEIPFKDKKYSFLVLMGDKDWKITDYVSTLDMTRINALITHLHQERFMLSLPKFKMEFTADLIPPLTAMGMQSAFNGGADFSSMVKSKGLFIKIIQHKTFIEVNEEGAEAAAVTAGAFIRSGPMPLIIDRPFVYFIRNNSSGLFLFTGIMRKPKWS